MISLEKIQEDVFLLHFVATNFLNLKYKVYCFPFLLIDDLEVNSKAKEILKSIISLAQSLGLVVVAEGVEQAGQYEELIRMKVDYIQGYYCARPLPLDEYEKILKLKK